MDDSEQNVFPLSDVSPDDTRMELGCGTTKMVLMYLEDAYGNDVVDEIVTSTRMNREYIGTTRNWISLDYYCRFLKRAIEVTGDPQVPFLSGTYSVKQGCFGAMPTLMARLGTVASTYSLHPKLVHLFNRVAVWEHESTGRCSCILTARYPNHEQDRNNCLAMQGGLVALPELHGCPQATVKHAQCACNGHDSCVYEISWIEKPAQVRALLGALIGLGIGLALGAPAGSDTWTIAPVLASGLVGYLCGRLFDYSTRLRQSYRYNERQAASLEASTREAE